MQIDRKIQAVKKADGMEKEMERFMRKQENLLEKVELFNEYIVSHAQSVRVIYLRESPDLETLISELRAIDIVLNKLPALTDISM